MYTIHTKVLYTFIYQTWGSTSTCIQQKNKGKKYK